MQYVPPDNELYREICSSGDADRIAVARAYADREFKADPSSWKLAVDRGMEKYVADGHK